MRLLADKQRFDRGGVGQINACQREMPDLITHPLHAIVFELRVVVAVEIIQADHRMPVAHQPQHAMGTNEAGSAGDQDFHGRNPSGAMWRRPMPL